MASFTVLFLSAVVSAATVYVFAGLGELISERAGVLNLGVEGMMLVGALSGYVTTAITGNYWLGFLVGSLSGAILSLLHAFLCISLNADQAISGIMITLLGAGATSYFGQPWAATSIEGFPTTTVPVVGSYLAELPYLGIILFQNSATDFIALALIPVVWAFLYKTNIGLELLSVGEDPETADTMGVQVFQMRYLAVVIGGLFAGAAGAHLSLSFNTLWSSGMTAGTGWIAVALVIFAQWRPGRVVAGAYLFATFGALQLRSQSLSLSIPADLPFSGVLNGALGFFLDPSIMSTYPYVVTILVLIIVVRRTQDSHLAQPSALVQSYKRELD